MPDAKYRSTTVDDRRAPAPSAAPSPATRPIITARAISLHARRRNWDLAMKTRPLTPCILGPREHGNEGASPPVGGVVAPPPPGRPFRSQVPSPRDLRP